MFSTLKKLRNKRKSNHKQRKDKKKQSEELNSEMKSRFYCSTFDLPQQSEPTLTLNSATRRHSCGPAILEDPLARLRSGSHSSRGSFSSTSSAESFHVRRLSEIAQLDRYIEQVKKSADDDNISYLPNRLCCAQLLKLVLQRRERQYMYDYLHSNRRASDTDIATKSKHCDSKMHHGIKSPSACNVSSDSNNNNKVNYLDCLNNNNNTSSSNDVYGHQNAYSKRHVHSHDLKKGANEHRVPGDLIKEYDSDGTHGDSGDSHSETEDSDSHHRYRKNRKTRPRSLALFPKNFEIY